MTGTPAHRTRGIIEVLLSGACFGSLGLIGKWAYASGLAPGELLAFRFLIATVVMGGALLAFKPTSLEAPFSQRMRTGLLGVLGYAVFSSFYFLALQRLSVSLTVLLLYAFPILVTLGARILFDERISAAGWISLPLLAGGLSLVLGGDLQVTDPLGILFGLLSAVFYALYILASSRMLKGADAMGSALHVQAAAGIALGALHLRDPSAWLRGLDAWAPLLAIAIVGTILPIALFLSGLRKIKSSEASVLSTAEPIVAIGASTLFFGEILTWVQVAGGLLVVSALLLTALKGPPKNSPDQPDLTS